MWEKLSKKEQEKCLKKWISNIVEDKRNTKLSVKKHIVCHAKDVFSEDPKIWSASMRNLIEVFEALHKIKPTTIMRLKRFERKYKKDPKKYCPPPLK